MRKNLGLFVVMTVAGATPPSVYCRSVRSGNKRSVRSG